MSIQPLLMCTLQVQYTKSSCRRRFTRY